MAKMNIISRTQIERYDIYIRDRKEKKEQYNSGKITDHIYDVWDHTYILTLRDAIGFMYHYPIVHNTVNSPFLI